MRNCRWFRSVFAALMLVSVLACSAGDPEQTRKDGIAFLEANAKKEGVMVTASGLQYKILQAGSGAQPAASDSVTVNYRGELINGSEFDSGQGISFPLSGVIPGWTEGLQLMKEGAKYRFFIPSELAYGESGAARVIPPNAALVFDVELVKVNR
ncbi:MAG: FKBP-type peptidyl-prolyl cis-trans isomerase [Methylococcaceae bacterium]|nr:FKBP-type peptidyl-prolyl cis-trans isomerase [Methylococcaceae bacterium]